MALKTRHLSAWRTITKLQIRHLGEWRRIRRLRTYHDGAWREVGNFLAPLTASATASDGRVFSSGPAVVTGSASAVPSGGLGPYSYAWTLLSWTGSGTPSLFGTTTATASVSISFPSGVHSGDATLQCVMTDALGATAVTSATINLSKETFD